MRGLIGLGLRNSSGLNALLRDVYDPSSGSFRKYMGVNDFMAQFGPLDADVQAVTSFLSAHGLKVERTAKNKMLLEFSGSVDAFNKAFSTTLHSYQHIGDSRTTSLQLVYGAPDGILTPSEFNSGHAVVLTADIAVDTTPESPDNKTVDLTPPTDAELAGGYTPVKLVGSYGFDALFAAGGKGDGQTIGIVAAYDYKEGDAQSFWQVFGLKRKSPIRKLVAEPTTTRVTETALDVQWAGMLAPNADIIVYEAPDIRDTSLLYAWNEAIGLAEATVITDSFGHRESSVSQAVAQAYDDGARMAGALGITVVAATGDTGGVDTPAACPHVTAVGGTALDVTADNKVLSEIAWFSGGAGPSKYFSRPAYQTGLNGATSDARYTADIALNAGAEYQTKLLSKWDHHGGTSFASPIFAAMVADAVSYRVAHGKGSLGYLNPAIYDPAQSSGIFRDITQGASGSYLSAPGWDVATGWGAPDALALAQKLP
jgi:kumamolisin